MIESVEFNQRFWHLAFGIWLLVQQQRDLFCLSVILPLDLLIEALIEVRRGVRFGIIDFAERDVFVTGLAMRDQLNFVIAVSIKDCACVVHLDESTRLIIKL